MPQWSMRILKVAALILAASPTAMHGQTYWRAATAAGVGATTSLVGMLIDSNSEYCDPYYCGIGYKATTITGLVGGAIGYAIGHRADAQLAQGKRLADGHHLAVLYGTFFGPAALGTQIAYRVISPPQDRCVAPPPGSNPAVICTIESREPVMGDAAVTVLAIGGGVVAGTLLGMKYGKALEPRVSVSPRGASLGFSARF